MYPPVVSLDGFANIDRGMFRAVSNLTEDLECCKEQVRSGLLYNSFKINLQIWGGVLESLRLDRLMYCTGIFTHISVRVFLLMDGQKLGVLETSGVLLHSVPTYEKEQYIYVHAIFCTNLPFIKKILTAINMLSLGTKCVHFLIMTIRNITISPLKLTASCYGRKLNNYDQFKFKHTNHY